MTTAIEDEVTVRKIPEAPRVEFDQPVPVRGVSLRGLPGCQDGTHILPAKAAP